MEIEDVYKKILKQYGLGEELLCEYLYRRSYEAIVEIKNGEILSSNHY